MTETDPRPRLAAMPLERLAPAAEALAEACAEDINAGPPSADDRARAEYHRAGRARLAHLGQLLARLDWSARRLPQPERDEFHYLGAVWTGRQGTPEFHAWVERQDRREARRRKRKRREKRRQKALAAQAGGGGDGNGGEEQGAAAGLHDEAMTHHDIPRHFGRSPARRSARADARMQAGAHYARAGRAPPATGRPGPRTGKEVAMPCKRPGRRPAP